jgi:hypothetical protein
LTQRLLHAFFEDLAVAEDHAADAAREALTGVEMPFGSKTTRPFAS